MIKTLIQGIAILGRNAKEYKKAVERYNRVAGQLRRYGIEGEKIRPVLRPTKASIKSVERATERLQTERFVQRVEEKRILREARLIIENFRNFIKEMIGDDYTLKYSHSFADSGRRTASGADAKSWSAEQIVGYGKEWGGILADAVRERGEILVAQSIQDNGEMLEELAEQLVYAIYESKYARWGGGRSAYTGAMIGQIKSMLTSATDTTI